MSTVERTWTAGRSRATPGDHGVLMLPRTQGERTDFTLATELSRD